MILRPAEPRDAAVLWEWRNDAATRAMSQTNSIVPWEDHRHWFAASLENPLRFIWMGIDENGNSIGMSRFDINTEKNNAEVSINLNPAARGKGYAIPLLRLSIELFTAQHPITLTATIHEANSASQRCFARCGFQQTNSASPFLLYQRPFNQT